jgi:peptidoglycan hydrolase CwlO-like protein
MVLGLFKKKQVMDLRPKNNDVLIRDKDKSEVSMENKSSSVSNSTENSGGIFGFFDNSSSSPVNSSYSSSDSTVNIQSELSKLRKRIDDLSTGISRLSDRVDLSEKKIDRLEGKSGY